MLPTYLEFTVQLSSPLNLINRTVVIEFGPSAPTTTVLNTVERVYVHTSTSHVRDGIRPTRKPQKDTGNRPREEKEDRFGVKSTVMVAV